MKKGVANPTVRHGSRSGAGAFRSGNPSAGAIDRRGRHGTGGDWRGRSGGRVGRHHRRTVGNVSAVCRDLSVCCLFFLPIYLVLFSGFRSLSLLLRGTIVSRTYGTHKKLPGIYLTIFTNNFWSY